MIQGSFTVPAIRKRTIGRCVTCSGQAEQLGVVQFKDLQCWVCRRLRNSVIADHTKNDTLTEYEEKV